MRSEPQLTGRQTRLWLGSKGPSRHPASGGGNPGSAPASPLSALRGRVEETDVVDQGATYYCAVKTDERS